MIRYDGLDVLYEPTRLTDYSFILVQNRQGKTRLSKWYMSAGPEEKAKLSTQVHKIVASRDQKSQSNFVEVPVYICITYNTYPK